MDGEMEETDYQAQCQAEAEAQGEAEAGMAAEAEHHAETEAENEKAIQEMFSLYDLREAIIKVEGVKIQMNIIKDYIQPLKEWLDLVLPKREVK